MNAAETTRFVLSIADDEEALAAFLADLSEDEYEYVLAVLASPEARQAATGDVQWAAACEAWRANARPGEQLPPGDDWLVWFYMAGRGAGKTRSGAEDMSDYCRQHENVRIALVSRTFADVRDTMVEGESGMLAVVPDSALKTGGRDGSWNRSTGELFFANGATCKAYSSERPAMLRGPQHHRAWCDEPAVWMDADQGDKLDTLWNNLMLGLRLGEHPQVVVTGTPKRVQLVRDLLAYRGLVLTRGSTYNNLANLAPTFRDEILARYEGTTIGRQELLGQMLDVVEGALWSTVLLDATRVAEAPSMQRVCVAVDPAASSTAHADHTGIVVVGRGYDGHGYAIDDRSMQGTPEAWGKAAVRAYIDHEADLLVYEKNQGGEMVATVLKNAVRELHEAGEISRSSLIVKPVHASRGKRVRAEPVHQLYEQGRFHHVRSLPDLEDELTSWTPQDSDSPDRMDALVWGATEIVLGGGGKGKAFGDQIANARIAQPAIGR